MGHTDVPLPYSATEMTYGHAYYRQPLEDV